VFNRLIIIEGKHNEHKFKSYVIWYSVLWTFLNHRQTLVYSVLIPGFSVDKKNIHIFNVALIRPPPLRQTKSGLDYKRNPNYTKNSWYGLKWWWPLIAYMFYYQVVLIAE